MRLNNALAIAAAAMLGGAAPAAAEVLPVRGGPTYDATTGNGFAFSQVRQGPHSVNAAGTAVGWGRKYVDNVDLGYRAFRWNAGGSSIAELGHLGTDSLGRTSAVAQAIAADGTTVGHANKHGNGTFLGERAVRWEAGSTIAIELGNLGIPPSGFTSAIPIDVNSGGTAVGFAFKYDEVNNVYRGRWAVRWDAGGTMATELESISFDDRDRADASAVAINDSNTIIGHARKFDGTRDLGSRAVRWDASGHATELGHLGTYSDGTTFVNPRAINANGTAVGYARKFIDNQDRGWRAVRWDAGSTQATELAPLASSPSGWAEVYAYAVNDDGSAVGNGTVYIGTHLTGGRAARWDPGSTTAIALDDINLHSDLIDGAAFAINATGIIVGTASKYDHNSFLGYRAVLWRTDGSVVDLNELIDPASGWTLFEARSISDTHFVAGVGLFDPDGAGPLEAYTRAFLLDATSAIPEPATAGLLAIISLTLLPRPRRRRT